MRSFAKMILAFVALGFVSSAQGAYWAKLDVSHLLSEQFVTIINRADRPMRCSLAAFNDKVWLEIGSEEVSLEIKVVAGVRMHNLSLYCQPVKQLTKTRPWRVNHYRAGSAHVRHTVFFPKR